MLHASQLTFNHPITQQDIVIEAPLDEQWLNLISQFKTIE